MIATINIDVFMRFSKYGLSTNHIKALIELATGAKRMNLLSEQIGCSKSWAKSETGVGKLVDLGLVSRKSVENIQGGRMGVLLEITNEGKSLFTVTEVGA